MKDAPESIPDALENLSRVMEHADSLWGFETVNSAVFKTLTLMAERIEKLEAQCNPKT